MPHFQVPDDRKFVDPSSGLKTWPSSPQGYRLFTQGPGSTEALSIHLNQEITLLQVGFDSAGKIPVVWSSDLTTAGLAGTAKGVQKDRQTFTVLGKKAGPAVLTAKDGAGNVVAGPLHIFVGKYENHPGMTVDLIAEIARGNDSLKLLAIQRMLYFDRNLKGHTNTDNIFEQGAPANIHKTFGNMACGIVAKYRGDQIFGNMTKVDYDNPYHEPLTGPVAKRSDVKYKADKIRTLQTKILAMLADGKPVRVGVLDQPIDMMTKYDKYGKLVYYSKKLVAYYEGGHSVLIVGSNSGGTQFLYIDPWGAGSQMKYEGGIAGNKPGGICQQLGKFGLMHATDRVVSSADAGRFNLMRQTTDTEGSFNTANGRYLEVVSAPWRL